MAVLLVVTTSSLLMDHCLPLVCDQNLRGFFLRWAATCWTRRRLRSIIGRATGQRNKRSLQLVRSPFRPERWL